MSLDTTTVVVPSTGHIFIAPLVSGVSPASPTNLATPGGTWVELGITSYDENLTLTKEGGEVTTLQAWQVAAVRTATTPTTRSIGITANQVDNTVLSMYFGGGDISIEGKFGVPKTSTPVQVSVYIYFADLSNPMGWHIHKAEISSNGDVSVDPENMLPFPLLISLLAEDGKPNLMTILNSKLGTEA